LGKNFLCVSANLFTGLPLVHTSGPLWRALRASGAIPGVVPPVVEDRHVLVDGGIMINLPTQIMKSRRRGPVIGVDVATGGSLQAAESAIEDRSMLWLLRHGRKQMPSIVRILMRCGTVNGEIQSVASRAAADLLIQPELTGIDMLSFQAFHQAVELGYRAGVAAIPRVTELVAKAD
jgi:NTE family protein